MIDDIWENLLMSDNNITNLIKSISNSLLRNRFKPHQYGEIILPFIVLKRLDTFLSENKQLIIKEYKTCIDQNIDPDKVIKSKFGIPFYNYSKFNFDNLKSDPQNIEKNFRNYLSCFSDNMIEIFHHFKLESKIDELVEYDILFKLIDRFDGISLGIDSVSNHKMGQIYEECIRYYAELYDEESGNHFTPRDIVKLLVSLVFEPEKESLKGKDLIRSIYDPCCGTGGMLTVGKDWILENINNDLKIDLYGQEFYPQSYAICKSDFLMTGENPEDIRKTKSTLTDDKFEGKKFHYMLVNPPFGVKWDEDLKEVEQELANPDGRFKWGRPNISDGTFLFVQEMVSKMNPDGSRVGFVSNYSPFFTGKPSKNKNSQSNESAIRQGLLEEDLVELIVQLPDRMFFNTGIPTFLWILSNKKTRERKGKVQLIDCSSIYKNLHQNLGEKAKKITKEDRDKIVKIYTNFEENKYSKIKENTFFGYQLIELKKYKKNSDGEVLKEKNKKSIQKKWEERIPLNISIENYLKEEVDPYIDDYEYDENSPLTGYQIDFIRYFYEFEKIENLSLLEKELNQTIKEINDEIS